jgi:membrane-bound ClpP family serine protease
MEILSWTGLGLVIVALALVVASAVTGRAKLNQAGSLVNVMGLSLLAGGDAHEGRSGFAAFFIFLAVVNVFNFFFSRSTERRKAAA